MNEEEKKKISQNIASFCVTFKKEIIDMFPFDNPELSPLLINALLEIHFCDGITPSILSKRLSITIPNTSRCLQQLEESNCVVKIKDEKDKRITHLKLTEKGLKVVREHAKRMDELVLNKLGKLDIEEMIKFSDALLTVKELLDKLHAIENTGK